MKRILCLLLALLLIHGTGVLAFAQMPACRITADSVDYTEGEVAVPIRIGDNPGFTNFAMELTYDARKLELLRIDAAHDGCLCPDTVSIHPDWKQDGNSSSVLVIAASAEAVAGDGILFTAVFRVRETGQGNATVVPSVRYIRNNTALLPVFEDISAAVTGGNVLIPLVGDLNGDGTADQADVSLIYSVYLGQATLTPEQMAMADANGDGIIEYDEVMKIYQAIWRNDP